MENVLVLNRSYMPINIIGVDKAFKKVLNGRAEIIHIEDKNYLSFDFNSWIEYSSNKIHKKISTSSLVIGLPKIIRVLHFDSMHHRKRVKLSRKSLAIRDGHSCAYCGKEIDNIHSTIDHVIPLSKGGKNDWENVVLACKKCNAKKADKLLHECGFSLRFKPTQPKFDVNKYYNMNIEDFVNLY